MADELINYKLQLQQVTFITRYDNINWLLSIIIYCLTIIIAIERGVLTLVNGQNYHSFVYDQCARIFCKQKYVLIMYVSVLMLFKTQKCV